VYFRHILFFFRKELKATEAQREICGVYGNSAISADTCQHWFARFRCGYKSHHPSITDDDQILAAIKVDRHLMTREIAERFNIAHITVSQRLKWLRMTKKADV